MMKMKSWMVLQNINIHILKRSLQLVNSYPIIWFFLFNISGFTMVCLNFITMIIFIIIMKLENCRNNRLDPVIPHQCKGIRPKQSL